MAFKLFAIIAILFTIVNAEDSNCDCEQFLDEDNQELWKFLEELSEDFANPQDEQASSVYPGILSPLTECNCIEKSRRKRKIFSEVGEEKKVVTTEPKPTLVKKTVRYGDRYCPRDYMRVGVICMPVSYMDD